MEERTGQVILITLESLPFLSVNRGSSMFLASLEAN